MSKPAKTQAKNQDGRSVVENRRARHDYSITDTYEAGIALQGSEVKALREGKGQIAEAYAMVKDGEVFVQGMNITAYSGASTHVTIDPRRTRKLLLHKREIEQIAVATQQKGMTLVPLRVYFKRGIAKMEIGLGRGKKNIDKRRDIAERDAKRQMERATRRRQKDG